MFPSLPICNIHLSCSTYYNWYTVHTSTVNSRHILAYLWLGLPSSSRKLRRGILEISFPTLIREQPLGEYFRARARERDEGEETLIERTNHGDSRARSEEDDFRTFEMQSRGNFLSRAERGRFSRKQPARRTRRSRIS